MIKFCWTKFADLLMIIKIWHSFRMSMFHPPSWEEIPSGVTVKHKMRYEVMADALIEA